MFGLLSRVISAFSPGGSAALSQDIRNLAMESSLDGIAILDASERYVYVNRAHAQIYGYQNGEDLIGKSWRILYSPEELPRFENLLMPRLRQEGRLSIEAVGKRKDGSLFPQELSLTAIPGGGLVCVVRDISARKRVEQDAEQVALFSSLNPSPVFRFDTRGQIIMANPAAVDFIGLMESPDIRVQDFIPNFSDKQIRQCIQKASVLTRSTWVRDHAFQFVIKGVPYLQVGHAYASDITGLMRAERELRESRAFLRELIDTDPNLIFVKDERGRFTLVNRAVAEAFGKTPEEIIGRRDDELNPNAAEVEAFQRDDQEVLRTGREKFVAEETLTDGAGKIHYLQTVKRPLLGPGGKGRLVMGVAADITAQKELQEMLVQSSKLEAIGQLAGGIAHDFNNILTGILGYTALLQQENIGPEEIRDGVEKIEGAALRAGELTEQLLGFARKTNEQRNIIVANNIVSESVALLSRTLEKSIVIESSLCSDPVHIQMDPVQLQQVILNLGINARDALSESGNTGGYLHIQSSRQDFQESQKIIAGILPPGEYFEVLVKDNGCGMTKTVLEKAFEPFFTTKETGKGTGMGLSLVYSIVRRVGGGVAVDTLPGFGSTFRVWIPLASSQDDSVRPEQSDPVQPKRKALRKSIECDFQSAHILLVDDHSVIRDSTSQVLRSMGYQVVTASNGAEAVEYYRKHQQEIDVIILDMIMPRMGARECFRVIKALNPAVKVILSTGYLNMAAVDEILRDGILGFVQKPYQLIQLNNAIQSALSSSHVGGISGGRGVVH